MIDLLLVIASPAPASEGGIDASIIVAIIALVSTIGAVVIANRYTARSAREAAAKSVVVEQVKLDEQRRQSLMDNMQEELNRLNEQRRKDREAFEAELEKTNKRLTGLYEEQERYRRERNYLQQQVDSLVLWSRAVVRVMRTANVQYPPPPHGVDTDPEGFPPLRGQH